MRKVKLLALLLCLCICVPCAALAEEDGYEMAHDAYGVSAEEALRMGVALAELVENAVAEGEQVSFTGLDELLAGAELSAMEALTPAEQALVVLSIMGNDDEIAVAEDELDLELSEDAQTLMDAVTERLGGMEAEQWTEYEGLLEACFPMVDSDGTMLLQLSLSLTGAKDERIHIFFVQDEDGNWWLSQIDTAA